MKTIFLTATALKLLKTQVQIFFIRKGIFHFFTKIQNPGFDPNKYGSLSLTQNRILWIHGLTRFFTRDPNAVNTSAVYTAHPALWPFFNPRHGLNDPFYSACFILFSFWWIFKTLSLNLCIFPRVIRWNCILAFFLSVLTQLGYHIPVW